MMQKLEQLRKQIEEIDTVIISKLAERQNLAKQIGQLKAETGKSVLDPEREAHLMHFYQVLSQEHQLDSAFIQQLFNIIISHSRSLQ